MAGWILYAGVSSVYHRLVTERIIASLVGPENTGIRLLELLCKRFTYCSQAQWQAFIEAGRLLVDGQPGIEDQRLVSGQRIEFRPPADLEPPVDSAYSIVFKNRHLLVIYKPPLLPIHPGGRFFAHTLWHLLDRNFGKVHIATRLDRETSGLVLAARDSETACFLQEQQGRGAIQKSYLALVHGSFPAGRMKALGWLVPDRQSRVRKKRRFIPAPDTEPADRPVQCNSPEPGGETCGTLLEGCGSWQTPEGPRSLVEARLLTGRTHQIRATLLSLGYPVLGDKLYGLDDGFFLRFMDNTLTPADVSRLVLPYQALHCASLDFLDTDGSRLTFSVAAPWAEMVKTQQDEPGH